MKTRIAVLALMSLFVARPMFGLTYKDQYPMPCGTLWGAVKDTLNNPDNYTVKKSEDGKMHAEYSVKHAVHVTITGALLQRTNKVTLVPNEAGCEMQVVSNYSGFEHDDRSDFKKRVDDALAKPTADQPVAPTESVEPAK